MTDSQSRNDLRRGFVIPFCVRVTHCVDRVDRWVSNVVSELPISKLRLAKDGASSVLDCKICCNKFYLNLYQNSTQFHEPAIWILPFSQPCEHWQHLQCTFWHNFEKYIRLTLRVDSRLLVSTYLVDKPGLGTTNRLAVSLSLIPWVVERVMPK